MVNSRQEESVFSLESCQFELKKCSEDIQVISNAKNLGNALDKINSQEQALDYLPTFICALINGYDNAGVVSAITTAVLKLKYGENAGINSCLHGASVKLLGILVARLIET